MLFFTKTSIKLAFIVNLIIRQYSVVAFGSQFSIFSATRISIPQRSYTIMQQQQSNNSGRKVVSSRDDAHQGKSERTNRLFCVLKGNNNPRPATAGDAVPSAVVTQSAAAGGDTKPSGRKRNRGKSHRGVENEQGPTKTAAPPAQIVRDSGKVGSSEAIDVAVSASAPSKPAAFMTNHEFSSLPISENSKRALAERMKIR